jgi:hypothetical protein
MDAMSEHTDPEAGPEVRPTGHAAWKAQKDQIAERNAQARKAGAQERAEHERETADLRREAAAKRAAGLRERESR